MRWTDDRANSRAQPSLITPRLTLRLPALDAQRSGRVSAEVGGSSPPRPTTPSLPTVVTHSPRGRSTDVRDGPRRLPLIVFGALGALIALILAGIYFYRATVALVDTGGSGAGGETTEVFTIDGAWDLRWSYDCSPSLSDLYPLAPAAQANPCYFIVAVKEFSDCVVSGANQGINVHARKSQGVVLNHAGGTFYLLVDYVGSWKVTVTGSGRASGVGPAPHCSEG